MPLKSFDNYKGVLAYLGKLVEKNEVGNPLQASVYKKAAKDIKKWTDSGMSGDCPVNLEPFGIQVLETGQPALKTSSVVPDFNDVVAETIYAVLETNNVVPETNDVKGLLHRADEMRKAEDYSEAAKHYRAALQIEPDNEHAKAALADCVAATDTVNLNQLKRRLKEKEDFNILERGIKEARKLEDGEKLPVDLKILLDAAEQRREEKRRKDGQITTRMHLDDLTELKKVVAELTEKIQSETLFWDPAKGQYKPTSDALAEAVARCDEASGTIYQRLVTKYEPWKIDSPTLAVNELIEHLKEPFTPQHQSRLEELLRQCRYNAEKSREAAAKETEARALQDASPVKALRLWYAAIVAWPHDQSRVASVEDARRSALSTCKLDSLKLLRHAENDANSAEDRSQALDLVTQSVADWPRDPRDEQPEHTPVELSALGERAASIRDEIRRLHALDQEWRRFETAVRALMTAGAFTDAREKMLGGADKFGTRDEYQNVNRDVAAGLGLAHEVAFYAALVEQDPDLVLLWALRVLPTAGALRNEVEGLQAQAELEMAMRDIRQKVALFDYEAAATSIRALKEMHAGPQNWLRIGKLLDPEIKLIKAAKDQPAMQDLFKNATRLRVNSAPPYRDQLAALQVFQYVGGLAVSGKFKERAPFARSWQQAAARKAADEMRAELIELMLQPFKAWSEKPAATPPNAADWERLCEMAELLLEYELLDEQMKSVVRAELVACAAGWCDQLEARGSLQDQIAVWQSLVGPWPGPDVRTRLQHVEARQEAIDEALKTADDATNSGEVMKALEILADALRVGNSKVLRDKREKIFGSSERSLLKTIGRCTAASPENVIGLALLAADELGELERNAERTPETVKAQAQRERISALLAGHPYANRLQSLTEVFKRLKDVHGLPKPDGTAQNHPDWSEWIVSDDWHRHLAVVNFSQTQLFNQLDAVVQFSSNLDKYRIARREVNDENQRLKRAWLGGIFSEVLSSLMRFEHFRDYQATVFLVMEPQIFDFGYKGVIEVRSAALRFQDEVLGWQIWLGDCGSLHAAACSKRDLAIQNTNGGDGDGGGWPLCRKRGAWDAAAKACVVSAQLRERRLIVGDGANDNPAQAQIDNYSTDGRALLLKCDEWLTEAEQKLVGFAEQIGDLGGFPEVQDFQRAVTALQINCASPDLANRLSIAKQIGSCEVGQESRIRLYEDVLADITRRCRLPWWKRLFGIE